jgi:DoxX-like family
MQALQQRRSGWILSGLVTLALAGSAMAKIGHSPKVFHGLIHAGFPAETVLPIALLELSCLILFLIPRTTVLGAFLLTGFFGGATVTHIVGGENILVPLAAGLVIWISAWLRVPELDSVFPLKRPPENTPAYGSARTSPSRT